MFDKAKQVYQLQKKARTIQKELRNTEIEAVSNDNTIKVIFTAENKIKEIEIAPEMLSEDKKRDLEKKLVQTISEALSRAQGIASEKMKDVMGDMGLPGM